jgi:hypothetical protein
MTTQPQQRLVTPPRRVGLMADGSGTDQRTQAALVRALDAGASIRRAAARVLDEMEEVTSPHGQAVTDLDLEDSAVIVIDRARATLKG